MVYIYSYLDKENDKDVINYVMENFGENVQRKLINKITAKIQNFCENMDTDGVMAKNAEWPICYFLLDVPNSDKKLRIFFAYRKNKFVLLTAHLIKPKIYWKKKEKKSIDKTYYEKISFSKLVYDDFVKKQEYDYKDITDDFIN